MDSEIRIKEEIFSSDRASEGARGFFLGEVSLNNDSTLFTDDYELKIKTENPLPDQFTKNESIACNNESKRSTDTQIEGETMVSESEREVIYESSALKVERYNTDNGIKIKQEIVWLEGPPETASIINNEMKEGMDQDLSPLNSSRLYLESENNGDESASFSSKDLQNDPICSTHKNCSDYEEDRNFRSEKWAVRCSIGNSASEVSDASCVIKSYLTVQNNKHRQEDSLDRFHSRRKSRKVHNCGICGDDFSSSSDLKQNYFTHKEKKQYSCKLCGRSFRHLSSLKRHNVIHKEKSSFKCEVCGKYFSVSSSFKTQNQVKKPQKCDICEKNFRGLLNLKTHDLIYEGKNPHKCKICGLYFRSLSNLKDHNLIHDGKKQYNCKICGKGFRHTSTLEKHHCIHEEKISFKCVICDNYFHCLSNLKRHNLIHEDKKPYECLICHKYFRALSSLKRHNLIHEGKRPYKCKICNKDFRESQNLKRHYWIHEGIKPYSCKICGKDFRHSSNLKKHSLKH